MLELIERKASGEEIAVIPEAPEPAAAPDLMAALEASLAAVRSDDPEPEPPAKTAKAAKTAKPKAPRKRTPSGNGSDKPATKSGAKSAVKAESEAADKGRAKAAR